MGVETVQELEHLSLMALGLLYYGCTLVLNSLDLNQIHVLIPIPVCQIHVCLFAYTPSISNVSWH